MGFNETPLFLLCDVVPKDKQKDIPLYIFESSTFTEDEKMQWLRLDYNIETEESERITVDQVNNLELSSSTASSTCKFFYVKFFSSTLLFIINKCYYNVTRQSCYFNKIS